MKSFEAGAALVEETDLFLAGVTVVSYAAVEGIEYWSTQLFRSYPYSILQI